MESVSEDCWARFEGLRYRLKSICTEADKSELASIDKEMIELRDLVLTALRTRDVSASDLSGEIS